MRFLGGTTRYDHRPSARLRVACFVFGDAQMRKCERMLDCPFFQKFPKNVASYRYVYCEGPKLDSCVRLTYKEKHGVKPPDELTPTGLLIDHIPES